MKISSREILIGIITLFCVLFGLTYWIGGSQIAEQREMAENKVHLLWNIQIDKRILEEQTGWNDRLAELQAELPVYEPGISVSGKILRSIRSVADKNGLEFVRSRADRERQAGTLYETTVTCDWRGKLEQLTRFLYEMNQQGLRFDIRELTVRPDSKQAGVLYGDMAIACAYRRAEQPEPKN